MDIFDGSPRERLLLLGMAGAVVLALAFLLWPDGSGSTAPSLDTNRDQALRELQLVETAVASRTTTTTPSEPRTPFDRAAVLRGAQANGLTLSRVEPGDGGALSLTFDDAQSAPALRFLQQLERTTDARITELEIDADGETAVDVFVTLEPGA